MNKAFTLLVSGVIIIAACGTQPEITYPERAAVISSANQQTTTKISEAVSALLDKNDIAIAEDAFTESDLLIIHRSQLLGRDYGDSVERFRLVKQNESCILVHEKSGTRKMLEDVTCEVRTDIE